MEYLLLNISNIILPAAVVAHNEAVTGSVAADKIGFIVMGIIVGPVFLLTLASMIESRNTRIPGLFLGAFVVMVSAVVLGLGAIGFALKFFFPL